MPTKKHFIETARLVAMIENKAKRNAEANTHADRYARENPSFNRQKFMDACNADNKN